MKYQIWLFIFAFVYMDSFAIKRPYRLIENPLPRFTLRSVDNLTGIRGVVQYNEKDIQVLGPGNNTVMLPIDFIPSTRDPQKELNKHILFKFFSDDEINNVALFLQIIKYVSPNAQDPNIQNIRLIVALYYIDVNQQSRSLITKKTYTYTVRSQDQDTYFFDVVLNGLNFGQSTFNIEREVI